MIVLSNTTAQVIPVGQSITFNTVIHKSGCLEGYRNNTGSVKLRVNGIYEISFNGNVTGTTAAAPVQLSVYLSGAALPETTMIWTPPVAGSVGNISANTVVRNCCGDYDRITVVNNGLNPITLQPNCCLFIKRVA